MSIYIVKHYWKDNENSTWECHENVEKSLFDYLKDNYHLFVKERTHLIKKNKKIIYLCYEDTEDIYHRPITNITFFVSNKMLEREFCKEKYNNLEMMELKDNKKIFYIIIAILLLMLLYFIFFNQKENVKESSTSNIFPIKIVNENDFYHLRHILEDLTQVNNQKIDSARSLYKEYSKILTYENIHIKILKNDEISSYVKLDIDGKRYIKKIPFKIQSKTYKFNLLIKEGNLFTNEIRYNIKLNITNNDLIKLYNNKEMKRKINKKYFILFEYIGGDNNG